MVPFVGQMHGLFRPHPDDELGAAGASCTSSLAFMRNARSFLLHVHPLWQNPGITCISLDGGCQYSDGRQVRLHIHYADNLKCLHAIL